MAPRSKTDRQRRAQSLVAACLALIGGTLAHAQSPTTPKPFTGFAPQGSQNQPPPREVTLTEKKFEDLSDKEISDYGQKAFTIAPTKWKHAETPNFVLHYRRATEAQKVAREVEFDLWFIATTLGAGKDRYEKKSHVYVFEDEQEWKQFLPFTRVESWAASFARGDELYLNVRREGGGFGSTTLAHETSHAVVARLYPGKRWPLWLNEGFAEYMGGASVAARKGQTTKRFQNQLQKAEMPLSTLEGLTSYPASQEQVGQLYQTSEKFVRFLMTEGGKERIAGFIDATLAGRGMQAAVLEVYSDKFKDWDAFQRRFERFTK